MNEQTLQEMDFSGRLDWGLWRKVLRQAWTYKRDLVKLAVVAGLLAAMDASFPLLTKYVLDDVIRNGAGASLGCWAAIYAGLTIVLCTLIYAFIRIAGKITTHLSHDIRRAGFARLQELSFSYYDRRPVGWLISRLTSDSDRLGDFIAWGLLDVVWCIALMFFSAAVMLWLDWRVALVCLAIVPVLLAVCAYFRRLLLESSRSVRKQNSLLTAAYNEGIMGVRTTKTLVREEASLTEFQVLSGGMYGFSVRNAVLSSLFWPLILTLGSVGTGLALWYGGAIALVGNLSLGTLVAFMHYTARFFDPVQQLAHVLTQSQRAQASAERILDLLETEPEIKDAPEVVEALAHGRRDPPREDVAEDGYPRRVGTIEFRDVTFSYKGGLPVLEHFSLLVPAGKTVALVGPTGGGKSTIVSLLCRFYEPTQGQILIDGVDYRRRGLHWLQSSLGIVLQTPHLFDGTVKENIRYGKLSASDGEVAQAATLVNAHGFISAMEKGYDSPVGPGGNKLSTGQKQLVSFARAVIADPQIFVMDEATSSVDTETEKLIQQGLAAVLRGRLSFVIAHRLSTIRHADLILVIEQGRITERGSHHELLAQKGHYYELYTRQFVQEHEEELFEHDEVEATKELGSRV